MHAFQSTKVTYVLLVSIASVLFFFTATQALAQGGAGVEISPAIIEETLDPGAEREYEIEVRNINSTTEEFFLSTRNIERVTDGGTPVFAREGEPTGFELSDWITLPQESITLEAGERSVITFTMNVPSDAAPGSHFGGVFLSVDPPELQQSGAAVGYQVANIVSILVSGDVVESASIRQFSTGKFFYGAQDVSFTTVIENDGTVLQRPAGVLQITNALGREVGQVNFNESGAGVFPGDTRTFNNLRWVGDGAGFGRYEAVLSVSYGQVGARQTMTSTVSFWILPLGIIGPAVGVLLVFMLVTYLSVRLYVQRTIARHSAGRRLVRRRNQNGPSLSLLLMVSLLVVAALFLLVMLVLFA